MTDEDRYCSQFVYDPRYHDPREPWEIPTRKPPRRRQPSLISLIRQMKEAGLAFEIRRGNTTIAIIGNQPARPINDNDPASPVISAIDQWGFDQ